MEYLKSKMVNKVIRTGVNMWTLVITFMSAVNSMQMKLCLFLQETVLMVTRGLFTSIEFMHQESSFKDDIVIMELMKTLETLGFSFQGLNFPFLNF